MLVPALSPHTGTPGGRLPCGVQRCFKKCCWREGCGISPRGLSLQDHNLENPIGVASTMAHEMGHNLGMDHDVNVPGCYCPVPREGGSCVMAGSIG